MKLPSLKATNSFLSSAKRSEPNVKSFVVSTPNKFKSVGLMSIWPAILEITSPSCPGIWIYSGTRCNCTCK